jgi:hypothetical protein
MIFYPSNRRTCQSIKIKIWGAPGLTFPVRNSSPDAVSSSKFNSGKTLFDSSLLNGLLLVPDEQMMILVRIVSALALDE